MTILTSKKVLLPAITTCTLPSNHAKYLQISLLDYLQSQLMNDGKHAGGLITYTVNFISIMVETTTF